MGRFRFAGATETTGGGASASATGSDRWSFSGNASGGASGGVSGGLSRRADLEVYRVVHFWWRM